MDTKIRYHVEKRSGDQWVRLTITGYHTPDEAIRDRNGMISDEFLAAENVRVVMETTTVRVIAATRVEVHAGFTREELKEAFERVQDPDNWKNPISTALPKLSDDEKRVIAAAVAFFAGCQPRFIDKGENTKVTAPGYYKAVGA